MLPRLLTPHIRTTPVSLTNRNKKAIIPRESQALHAVAMLRKHTSAHVGLSIPHTNMTWGLCMEGWAGRHQHLVGKMGNLRIYGRFELMNAKF